MLQLRMSLQPKQALLLRRITDPARVASRLMFGGARGAAKSGGGRLIALALLCQIPGLQVLLLRRTFDEVNKNHILPLFRAYPDLAQFWRAGDKILALPNGSRLHFGYAENPGDVRRYRGQEFDLVIADDCGDFDPEDLAFLPTVARSTKRDLPWKPATLYLPNPGGPAHAWFKAHFFDREFTSSESPEQWDRIITGHGWDNWEWARADVERAGHTYRDYYGLSGATKAFTEDERKEWFLRSDYGKALLELPPYQQRAHLWGDWSQFAGQFLDFWGTDYYSEAPPAWQPWNSAFAALDYGWDHPFAGILFRVADDGTAWAVAEHAASNRTPEDFAGDLVSLWGEHPIEAIYLSPDAFAQRKSIRTIGDEMTDVFEAGGLPAAQPADWDRVGGCSLVYSMLRGRQARVAPSCPRTAKAMGLMVRNPDKDGEWLKVDGDDYPDAFRYGVKTRQRTVTVPARVLLARRISQITDPTARVMAARRAELELEHEGDDMVFSLRGRRAYA